MYAFLTQKFFQVRDLRKSFFLSDAFYQALIKKLLVVFSLFSEHALFTFNSLLILLILIWILLGACLRTLALLHGFNSGCSSVHNLKCFDVCGVSHHILCTGILLFTLQMVVKLLFVSLEYQILCCLTLAQSLLEL